MQTTDGQRRRTRSGGGAGQVLAGAGTCASADPRFEALGALSNEDVVTLKVRVAPGYVVELELTVEELGEFFAGRDGETDPFVGTTWLSDTLGMSRDWWTQQAPRIEGAWQEGQGSPWYVPLGAAKQYLADYRTKRTQKTKREARRGPWKR